MKRRRTSAFPQNDPLVYRTLQEADTIGLFQVESRAQQSILPRMRPVAALAGMANPARAGANAQLHKNRERALFCKCCLCFWHCVRGQ
jgi:hypothetical protein